MKLFTLVFLGLQGSTAFAPSPLSKTTLQTTPLFVNSLTNDDMDRRNFFSHVVWSATAASILSTSLVPEERANAIVMPDLKALAGTSNKMKVGGLSNKIRSIARVLDELQRDLMQERWELVENYPPQLRSFVPVLTMYTDSAFPTDAPVDKGLRVALRYEVGRFFASLERLRQATARKSLDEAYVAYGEMSLHFDRYLRVGGLYTYYDNTISTEPYFKGISEEALVYSDPIKDPAEVRDLVMLCKGPDKGKTGILIAIYPDGKNKCIVKLDKYKGLREIRVVPRAWAAKRLGEQDPDDAFLIPRKV